MFVCRAVPAGVNPECHLVEISLDIFHCTRTQSLLESSLSLSPSLSQSLLVPESKSNNGQMAFLTKFVHFIGYKC